MKRLNLLFFLIGVTVFTAKAQRPFKNNNLISGFYATTMDKMLDTIGKQFHLEFVYDKDVLSQFDVVDHYMEEPIKDLLKKLCKDNHLRYWVESDETIYILLEQKDLARLKKLRQENLKKANMAQHNQMVRSAANVQIPVSDIKEKTRRPFDVSGRVIDQSTGESLPSARIKVRNSTITAATNVDGYFTLLNVPADTCHLEISYMGYIPEILPLNAENIKSKLTIGLFTATKELSEVMVTDKKSQGVMNIDKRQVSVLQITPAKLDELPNIGEKDIMRSFQLMPGISASNESSSGAYVRGGTPDQNLVLFDGFTVYQVDHLYGFFSAFNSNAVKDVTLYKGGFSAKYGGRLSSVTDIVGKEGDKNAANIGIDLSLLSTNVYGELPVNKKSTLLLAYRRSYQGPLYDKIFGQFNNTSSIATPGRQAGGGGPPGGGGGPPTGGSRGGGGPSVSTPASYFYDFNAKYTYQMDDKNLFSWSLYQGNDNLDNSRKLTLPSFISSGGGNVENNDKTTYGNLGSSFKWSRPWNSKLYSNTLLSYSSYHSDRDNSMRSSTTNADGETVNNNNGTYENNKLKD
jgi:ferric enterobactin receptor